MCGGKSNANTFTLLGNNYNNHGDLHSHVKHQYIHVRFSLTITTKSHNLKGEYHKNLIGMPCINYVNISSVGISKDPFIFPQAQFSVLQKYLLDTFNYIHIWHMSWAAVTPVKYKHAIL